MIINDKTGEKSRPFKAIIDNCEYEFENPQVTAAELLKTAGKIPIECHSIYQKLEGCDFELVHNEDLIDLRQLGIERFQVKEPTVYNYTINGEPELTDRKHLTPSAILMSAGINASLFYLVQLQTSGPKINYAFTPEKMILLHCVGMTFVAEPWSALIDIEEYGKICKEVTPAKQYKIKVDKNYHLISTPYITGKQLIELEHKQPIQNWDVYKFYSNSPKPQKVGQDEVIDLLDKCLVRFVLQPKEQKDGKCVRKEFALPSDDIEQIENLGLQWETLSSGGLWLVVHDYPIPRGYNTESVQLALMISPNYPAAEIDMAYFHPHLAKLNGKGINALSAQLIDGKNFQRWSRHRLPGEWRPGIDNVLTHLALVDNWLLNDLNR